MALAAGKLKHPVWFEYLNAGQSASGAPIEQWLRFATTRAGIKPLSGRELITAKGAQSTVTHKVVMYYLSGLTTDMRMIYDSRPFEIVGIVNVDEANREMELQCVEQVGETYSPIVTVTAINKLSGFDLQVVTDAPIIYLNAATDDWLRSYIDGSSPSVPNSATIQSDGTILLDFSFDSGPPFDGLKYGAAVNTLDPAKADNGATLADFNLVYPYAL